MPRGIEVLGNGCGQLPLTNSGLGFAGLDIVQKTDVGFSVARLSPDAMLAAAKSAGSVAVQRAEAWLAALTSPRPNFAGLDMAATRLMGVVNATPDSFSDGGEYLDSKAAIAHAKALARAGADIIDVGGESTRPRPEAKPLAPDIELSRILPVITHLAKTKPRLCISADTRNPTVMAEALAAGADIINDVSGMGDKKSVDLLAQNNTASAIVMHMQGTPASMQHNPQYQFAPTDIYDWLEARIADLEAAGVKRQNITADIGFGFGKTPAHNMQLMANLAMFHGLGVPLALGVSRKSTIAHFADDDPPPKQRLGGSLALAMAGYAAGVQIIRAHDVAATKQALLLAAAVRLHATK